MVIRSELINIFITSDGTRFTKREEAEFHQQHVIDAAEELVEEVLPKKTNEEEMLWRQTKAKQRAIDLSEKLFKK